MANLIDSKRFCAPLAMLPGLNSVVMMKWIVFATRQSLLSLSLTIAMRSTENVPFGALVFRVICHEVSSPSSFFLATEFLFMATILQLKVAKRWLFEKVSLERCIMCVNVVFCFDSKLLSQQNPCQKYVYIYWQAWRQDARWLDISQVLVLCVYGPRIGVKVHKQEKKKEWCNIQQSFPLG